MPSKEPNQTSIREWLIKTEEIFRNEQNIHDDLEVVIAGIELKQAGAQGPYLRVCLEILQKYSYLST